MTAAAEYVLTADYLHRQDDKGVLRELRRGAILTDLSDDDVRRLVSAGAIVDRGAYERAKAKQAAALVTEDEHVDSEPVVSGIPGSSGELTRPKTGRTTEVWRAYAVAKGIPADEAAGMSKKQLIEATR